MSEMGDVAIQEFRTQIGHIHNYFPHHRYGDYFIQGKDKKGEVVYREHFDAAATSGMPWRILRTALRR